MEVHFTPDVRAKLDQMAREIGCRSEDLVEEAVLGYFDELGAMLDSRYDRMQDGTEMPIGCEPFMEAFLSRPDQLLKKPLLQ